MAKQEQIVSVFDLTDPATAGKGFEILDQDIVKLESKPLDAKRVVIKLEKSTIVYHSTRHRVCTYTKIPPGVTVFTTFGPASKGTLNGLTLSPQSLVASQSGAAAELVVEAGYESIACIFGPEELSRYFKLLNRDSVSYMPEGVQILQPNSPELRYFFKLGKNLIDAAVEEPAMFNDNPQLQAMAHTDLLEALIQTLNTAEYAKPSRHEQTKQNYSNIIRNVQDYVMGNQSGRIYMADLCIASKVSERTLQVAFQKIMSMSPITYLTQLRLHHVRKELCGDNDLSLTVSSIALKWGFWHFGEFSKAYKKYFGELPSYTLKNKNQL